MPRRLFLSAAVIAFTVLSLSSRGMAQTIYWNGNGGSNVGSWNTTTDWWTTSLGTTNPGAVSGGSIIATFNATGVSAAQTITLDANQVVQGLVFSGTDLGGETINSGTGTNTLTIGSSGIVDYAGSGADAINANILLGASQTWLNNSANTLTVSGNISDGGQNFGLTFAGIGTTVLSGSNTYAGATAITNNLGTLRLNFSAANSPANVTVHEFCPCSVACTPI